MNPDTTAPLKDEHTKKHDTCKQPGKGHSCY